MFRRPPLALVILLLSFPQIVETIYSPALPLIAVAYRATPEEAAQTLSLWFVAFAFGVVSWGRICDLIGRRPALLAGLALYAIGAGWAMIALDFPQLLLARLISAFGAAVGSIVTQTSLRDSYRGTDLSRVFALLGLALAVSPAIGMFLGQAISSHAGHQGVFAGLGLLAVLLLVLSLVFWPETRPPEIQPQHFLPTLQDMLRDGHIWRNAVLIAAFNLAIFGYYQLGPFLFERLEDRWLEFGESGLVLAAASLLGACANSLLLRRGSPPRGLVGYGVLLLAIGALVLSLLASGPAFVIGMAVVALAYAMAIPNILAEALQNYTDRLGTAGAILSMLYYTLLGLGLVVAGWGQRLDLLVLACAMLGALAFRGGQLPRK
ncbi:MFS transporter [Rhodovulum sulfidophilum]|uniref:MFS transporter n=1 Tax=Rhodovulum sulfidophilum TaxID=35806 RepID=UPI001924BB42|nr:MFS transporter [Rhodovulum sulfidophilum]MBL3575537.1 MFS transporter [Rhodovulum sulfidophilum]MCE8431813.1 MFS transporter [Rhodovulum sulfidophilum]MCF4118631.1 MFS transporter [Rhodovulum sulfidophilum]